MNRPVTSASNLFRRALCPGSERMEYGLPEDDSEQSREGKLLHDYAAHPEYDRSVLRPDQRDLLERNDALVTHIATRINQAHKLNFDSAIAEREITLSNDLISGTPDTLRVLDDDKGHRSVAAWVNDAKFGYRVVERADLNLQLRSYAVLTYDYLEPSPPGKIFVSLTQPRLPYEERITLAMYTPEDIEASRKEIAGIIKRAGHDRAKLVAGEDQCRYCKAKLTCPAYNKTLTVPVLALRPQQDLSKTARDAYLENRIGELSDAQIEKLKLACSFGGYIQPLVNEEIVRRKRANPDSVPNYALSKPAIERNIVDPQRAISLLALAKIASNEEIMQICSVPLGQVEEMYRKRTDCTWNEAREKVNKVLSAVIETKEQKPKVIRK